MSASKDNPTLIIESNVWDMTWILNKTARLVEKYKSPITINIKNSNSVEVEIIFGIVVGGFGGEMAKLFAHDIYFYVKSRIFKKETGMKPPKRRTVKKGAFREEKYEKYYDKKIEMPEKEIEIRWNKRWEEEGFPTDDKDDKGRYLY